jgi:glycosyltransferase involved in cell wall biosynthesis
VSLPRITVVTPSFEQGRFLEAAILSVLDQGYPDLEYFVMDGGSKDGSREVIERHAHRLAGWRSAPDGGQAAAINEGLARGTGEVMGWLNSDDLLLPGALRRIGEAFRDPRVLAVCGWRELIDESGGPVSSLAFPQPTPEVLRRRPILPQETVYWRRSLWERLGPLDASLRFSMDLEYWLRMLEHGVVPRLIPEFLGVFRWQPGQKSQNLLDVAYAENKVLFGKALGVDPASVDPDRLKKQLPWGWKLRLKLYRKATKLGWLGRTRVPG